MKTACHACGSERTARRTGAALECDHCDRPCSRLLCRKCRAARELDGIGPATE